MTVFLIQCPYCCLEISDAATVCGHCTRDLSFIKPLIAQYSRSIAEIGLLRLEVNELRKELEDTRSFQDRLDAEIAASTLNARDIELINKLSGVKGVVFFVCSIFLTAVFLIFTHWMMLFVYDFNLLSLRIATVILPLIIGTLFYRKIHVNFSLSILGSVVLGVGAISGMLGVTSQIDKVAFLPDTTREWREVVEYGFAITCSFFTAYLLENQRIAQKLNFRKKINLKLLIEKDATGQFKAPEWTSQVQSLFNAIAPFLSAGTAIVSGLRVFITN